MRSEADTVTDYLANLAPERREALAKLRSIIKERAPETSEKMKYGHPHYELAGPLFALASQKHHMALYVAEAELIKDYTDHLDLPPSRLGKNCIRFRKLADLPLETLGDLVADAALLRREAMTCPRL